MNGPIGGNFINMSVKRGSPAKRRAVSPIGTNM
jgi:hypothetical protein